MIIRFELPDKDGQAFKDKSKEIGMSTLIRLWISEYLGTPVLLPRERRSSFGKENK